MARVTMGSHSFTSHPRTNHTCLYSPAAKRHSQPFGWYSLHLSTNGWPGWVDPGVWSHNEINAPHRELNPDTITHPSTNRVRRRATSFIWNVLRQLRNSENVTDNLQQLSRQMATI